VTSIGLGLIPIAALLLAIGWAIAMIVVGLVLRFGSGAEALAWGVLFVVMPLSGVFYPVTALPAVLRPIGVALRPRTRSLPAGCSPPVGLRRGTNSGSPVWAPRRSW